MNILVTGGVGYIGSHTCVELLNNNHKVILDDNLFNSKIETIDKIKQITNKEVSFYKIDVTDEEALESIFVNNKIDGVIHFAGLKAVGESVEKPMIFGILMVIVALILRRYLSGIIGGLFSIVICIITYSILVFIFVRKDFNYFNKFIKRNSR